MQDVRSVFKTAQFPVCLAPMVGLTNYVLRTIVKDYMPKDATTLWPTEMLNSRRLPIEVLGASSETFVSPDENHMVPQILGNEFDKIKQSVSKLNQHWNLAGIDINMGCPVQKALKHNYGVSLMGDVQYAADVVKYAVEASKESENPIPVSVKLRSVEDDIELKKLFHFVDQLVNAGASWITLHPRTAGQQRRGKADWSHLRELKKHLHVPLIGNGDIQTADDVFQMLEETNVDKVMAGRALTARPWLMWQVGQKLGLENPIGKESVSAPEAGEEEGAEYGKMLLKFIHLSEEKFINELHLSPGLVSRKIQFFVRTSHVWLQFGHALMTEVNRSQNLDEMKSRVNDFFSKEQVMFKRTDLRQ